MSNSRSLYPVSFFSYNQKIMLSYRHAFHAGNHADILKHAVIASILSYMAQKIAPLSYIDTHAGLGLYEIESPEALTTQEPDTGIHKLVNAPNPPKAIQAFTSLCTDLYKLGLYPGSPTVAEHFLREQDELILMELHPQDVPVLKENLSHHKNVHIHHRDGFAGLIALTPPKTKRGLILIDPSYETEADWLAVPETLSRVYKKWSGAVTAVWYPIVPRKTQELYRMKQALHTLGGEKTLDISLEVKPAPDDGFGLIGSGMFIINPPWTLESEVANYLPWLKEVLA